MGEQGVVDVREVLDPLLVLFLAKFLIRREIVLVVLVRQEAQASDLIEVLEEPVADLLPLMLPDIHRSGLVVAPNRTPGLHDMVVAPKLHQR